MIGLTSVTFRGLGIREIVRLAAKAGLEGIEWGADVHVKPGDARAAESAGRLTEDAGLQVLSYGSYLRLGDPRRTIAEFDAVLESAVLLRAPMIRVWAGTKAPKDIAESDYEQVAESLSAISRKAAECGIRVSTEYHRGTLTENAGSALKLLETARDGYTYWQPNPEISGEENLLELAAVRPFLTNIHVFHWLGKPEVRYPLADGESIWKRYIAESRADGKKRNYILEFVKDDDEAQLLADAKTLRRWMDTEETDEQ